MSKRLKEVLANRLHISFLETIENDPCDFVGTMRITVREQQEDGTPWLHEKRRVMSNFAIHRTYAVNMIFPLMRKAVRAVS